MSAHHNTEGKQVQGLKVSGGTYGKESLLYLDADGAITDKKTDTPYMVTSMNFSYEEVWNDPDFEKTLEGGADIELGGLLDDLAWEFVGEFHRRQDLIRFRTKNGSGPNVWNGKSWFCKRAEEDPNDYHKNLYPISTDNMNSNIRLVQNPGYPQRDAE